LPAGARPEECRLHHAAGWQSVPPTCHMAISREWLCMEEVGRLLMEAER
jgi:hypothetical protein